MTDIKITYKYGISDITYIPSIAATFIGRLFLFKVYLTKYTLKKNFNTFVW
jgi:hypothetical protein